MFTLCWSVKGGCGTSVVAAAIALRDEALLVDLDGDAPAVLGLAEPEGPGVLDWLSADDEIGADALIRLSHDAGLGRVGVVPRGVGSARHDRWPSLAAALQSIVQSGRSVVVDAGVPRGDAESLHVLGDAADAALLVLRPCYLALRRAAASSFRPTGVVLIAEPGRSIGRAEVERVVGAPVVAAIPFDPAIARCVDAGLLAARVPRVLSSALVHAA